jgi:glycerol-3-phosphate responsive antiterminator
MMLVDKDLIRGLSEKEVEIEHLKTTMVALQQKVEVRYSTHTKYFRS